MIEKRYQDAVLRVLWSRRGLAYEAGAIAEHLEFRSFPQSARPMAEFLVASLRSAARGEVVEAFRRPVGRTLSFETTPTTNQGRAYEELLALRHASRVAASALEAMLEYKTFPKSRRAVAAAQIERLRSAAEGHAEHSYSSVNSIFLNHALDDAGASRELSIAAWEVL